MKVLRSFFGPHDATVDRIVDCDFQECCVVETQSNAEEELDFFLIGRQNRLFRQDFVYRRVHLDVHQLFPEIKDKAFDAEIAANVSCFGARHPFGTIPLVDGIDGNRDILGESIDYVCG